jgi:pimeloyl-ACP methyl ester carboxylesterase
MRCLVLAAATSLVLGSGVRATPMRATPGLLRLPPPTGPASVGTRSLMLVDRSRVDPFDPRRRHRRLLVQLWYPAVPGGPRAAYLTPRVARIIAAEHRLPAATFAHVRTNSYRNARPLGRPGGYPAVLFSPGYGVPHALYTTLLEDLASQGFVVIALDHTYETDAVEFPNGELVRRHLPADPGRRGGPASYRLLLRIIGQRVADVRFLRRSLPVLDRRVGRIIDRSRVGVFGHSLGGLTAAAALEQDRALRAGVDLDGSIFGPGMGWPLGRPFMIMTEHGDGTMLRFWRRLRGARLFVRIAGTRHLNFSDWNVLVPWLRRTRTSLPVVGTIKTARALKIERAYLDAFFGRHLSGASAPLLDSPSPFPEVQLER